MSAPLGTQDRAILTARAGILRAGTGRANAAFSINEMREDATGRYVWEDEEDDIASATTWVEYDDDINGG